MRKKITRKPKSPKNPRKGKYNIPNEDDIKKHEAILEKLGKPLDKDGRPKPLTENQLKQLIRSAVRQKWMHCNAKLHFLNSKAVFDFDEDTRRRKKWLCNICSEWYGGSEVQVDHRRQEETFTSLEDALPWASSILDAGGDEDLQIACIPCHSIKSLLDSLGMDYRDPEMWEWGKVEKEVIAICKGDEKQWLSERGVVPGSNAKIRRGQVREYLLGESD